MTISERIFEKLNELSVTQKKFCELTGIKQTTVSEWKKKKSNPSADKIMVICSVLDVTPEWLLSGTEVASTHRSQVDWFVIDRSSELGGIIIEYNKMDAGTRGRLVGYVDALKELKKK